MSGTTIVIGAGFGGLAAAIQLAAAGERVIVLEAADAVGGKAGTASFDGASFDTGPSLLTLPEVPETLFALAGATLRERVELRRLSPAFRYHFADGVRLDVHDTLEETLEKTRSTLGADAAGELHGFARYAERIWQASAPSFVYGDAPAIRSMLAMDVRTVAGLSRIDPLRAMQTAIDAQVRNPHLRRILYRYATYNGSDVRVAPATLNCIASVELGRGGFGVEGGIGALAGALAALATELGVEIRFGTRVDHIASQAGRVVAVQLQGGSQLPCGAVVSNADARHLHQSLLSEADRPPRREQPASMSGYNAVFRVPRRPDREAVAHQVVFADDYLDEFAAIFDRGTVTPAPTVYACNQRVAHGRAGWADADALFVMINAPSVDAASAPVDASRLREQARTTLSRAGICDVGDEVVWERTPEGLAARFPGSAGALYGAASNAIFSAFRRPANRSPLLRGLYLASGTAHPGGGVPLAMLSGMAAARALLRDIGRPVQAACPTLRAG